MPSSPLAYFIAFSTYGAWLHGRDLGSVGKQHNEVGTPFLPPHRANEQCLAVAESVVSVPLFLRDEV
jgi:hypothetical protein